MPHQRTRSTRNHIREDMFGFAMFRSGKAQAWSDANEAWLASLSAADRRSVDAKWDCDDEDLGAPTLRSSLSLQHLLTLFRLALSERIRIRAAAANAKKKKASKARKAAVATAAPGAEQDS